MSEQRNQRGELWDETRARLEHTYHSLGAGGRIGALPADRLIEVLGRILKDTFRTDLSSGKRGWRPQLSAELHLPMIRAAIRRILDDGL